MPKTQQHSKVERFAATLTAMPMPDGMPPDETDEEVFTMALYTGAPVERYDWSTGESYMLQLGLDAGEFDLAASDPCPLLNGHQDFSVENVFGQNRNFRIENGRLLCDTRFSAARPEAQIAKCDVKAGILTQVSVGAVIRKLKDVTPDNAGIKQFRAISWYAREGSLVPIAADRNAGFLSATEVVRDTLTEARATAQKENNHMVETTVNAAGATVPPQADINAVSKAAALAERERCTTIREITSTFRLPDAFCARHIADGTEIVNFRAAVLEQLAAAQERTDTRSTSSVAIMRDAADTRRETMCDAVCGLTDPKAKLDGQNPFRGMGLLRMAEECLSLSGVNVRGMSRTEIANLSMQNTADFPAVLENSARKKLLAQYGISEPTYRAWTSPSTTPDFKTMSRSRLSEAPTLLKVAEGAQISIGTMSDNKETYAIATYGRGVSFTRQMLINDDLGAFMNLIGQMGAQAARLENKTVYAILTANAAMSDSVALFYATHSNLGTGVIGNTGLDAAVTAFRTQKGIDGVTILNLEPKFLIVPAAKATTAQTAMTAINPNIKISDQNWFSGRFTVVSDGELDANSTVVWYMACDPAIAPGIEYAFLEGAPGPQILRKDNEDGVLGVQLYCYLDFGAKAVDFRSLYKSSGA